MNAHPNPATVTMLFTDLVDSTGTFERLGDAGAQELRRAHFRLLRESLASHGGQEVKNLGDGLMVVFPSALDAVSCAVAMQQAVFRHNAQNAKEEHLGVRVGLHAGEPIREEEDYFGMPVVIAKRVCDSADGGQILATELVRGLVAGRGDVAFADRGERALKGVAAPMRVYELAWSPAAEPAAARWPLPPVLASIGRTAFVARGVEIIKLREAWEQAVGGQRQLVMLAGEPGIGKTRLAAEFAREAHAQGATVLFGRSDEDALVPYQPFVESLRYYVGTAPVSEIEAAVGGDTQIVTLLPEVAERLPGLTLAPGVTPDSERFRLFESVAAMLARASGERPVVLLLDDLHWSDKPSLLLLRHVLRGAEPARLLLIGTYRETDLARTHPLAEMLADLRRESGYTRVAVRGLDESGVDAMVDAWAGHEAPRVFTRAVHEQTEGNPFFIMEVLEHLRETGVIYQRDGQWTSDATTIAELSIPEGVREVIGRRLGRISENGNLVLAHASVLGREFEFETLAGMTGLAEDAVLSGIEEALAARLIEETRGRAKASYAFSHALVRQTLYEEMTLPRKQKLHLRAAETIEAMVNRAIGPYLPSLAVHYRLAGASADAEKAIDYSLRAGDAARNVFAYEEAAAHWDAALELMEEGGASADRRAHLLEKLGDLMYVGGLGYERGVAYIERALAIYEQMGQAERAAQMHSRLGRDMSSGTGSREQMNISKAIEHFRAAEAVLTQGPERPALAYLYIGIAAACVWGMRAKEGLAATTRALEISERLGHEVIRLNAEILHGNFLRLNGRDAEGKRLMEEAWEKADRLDSGFLAFLATQMVATTGDHPIEERIVWCERELSRPRSAQAPAQRRTLLDILAGWHIARGDLESAERILDETGREGMQSHYSLLMHTGGWEEVEKEYLDGIARSERAGSVLGQRVYVTNLGTVYVMRGDAGAAESLYRKAIVLSSDHRVQIYPLSMLAVLCAADGRIDEAAALTDRARALLPDTIDHPAEGDVQRATGAIAAAKGDLEGAERAFARALDCYWNHPVNRARTLHEWGRALLKNGRIEDARARFDDAIAILREVHYAERYIDTIERERDAAR
ncbi:MAG: AAA family ATPase [Chloroflexota bacterium]|nr:AAA family ATPase [Chloroflexota bacterium]